MAADEPPYLTVGTDVSAKYKGAFCEAKVKKVNRMVKCKLTFQNNQGSFMVPDDQIKGSLRIGALVEARHPDKNTFLDAVINKMQDYSQYTVVFDDGDETTLRRTSLCLKSGRHFAESPTLDQFPLTNPEHFGTPVIGVVKSKRKRRSTYNSAALDYSSSEEELVPKKTKSPRSREKDRDIGKVVCVEYGDRRKKDNWYPGLVVLVNSSQDTFKINTKEEYLIRSFKDGKYYQVPKRDTREFSRDVSRKVESNTLKTAVEKALLYCEKGELPPHWDKALYLGLETASGDDDLHDTDSDTSDDEPSEEKDRFVAQLYKFMDERGTPINKAPTVSSKDVNLYKLFKVVHKMGGYNRVTNQNKWKIVYTKMGLQSSNPSGANQLKVAYKRFLHSFEDFYRKLGCTMVTNSRSTRGRHRSDRNFMITRNTVSTKVKGKNKDKILENKTEEKLVNVEKKEIKAKSDTPKTDDKPKKKSEKMKADEKDLKTKPKVKEEEKPRLVRSQSLNKEKRENSVEKKDSRTDRARTREESKKEKAETPEKKETRSTVKLEQEREKKDKSISELKANDVKEGKDRSPREKREEKIARETRLVDLKDELPQRERKLERPWRDRLIKEERQKPKYFEKVTDKKDDTKEKRERPSTMDSPKHENKIATREKREKCVFLSKAAKEEPLVKIEQEDMTEDNCPPPEKEPKITKAIEPKITKAIEPKIAKAIEPKIPKAIEPKVPKAMEPKVTKATDPKIPKATEPKVPKATEPKIPKATEPKIPKATEPKIPKATEPKIPKATEPKIPKATEPKIQKTTEPKIPKATEPKIPKATEPKIPKATEAKIPKATEPKITKPTELKIIKATEPKITKAIEPMAVSIDEPVLMEKPSLLKAEESSSLLVEVKVDKMDEDLDNETNTSQSGRSVISQDEEENSKEGMSKDLKINDETDDNKSFIDLTDSDDDHDGSGSEKSDKEGKERQIDVGDKVKVKYGRGRTCKVYEAKVLKVEMIGGEKKFFVHYAGWNIRYDEWIRSSFIVENVTERSKLSRLKRQDMAKGSLSFMKKSSTAIPPGFPSCSRPIRKNSTSSTTSVSSSRTTRSEKNSSFNTSPLSRSLQPRRRMRRKSGISVLTDTSQDSESDEDDFLFRDRDIHDDEEDDRERESDSLNKSFGKDEIYSDQEMEACDMREKVPDCMPVETPAKSAPGLEKREESFGKMDEPFVSLVKKDILSLKESDGMKPDGVTLEKRPSCIFPPKGNAIETNQCGDKKQVFTINPTNILSAKSSDVSVDDIKFPVLSAGQVTESPMPSVSALTKPCDVKVSLIKESDPFIKLLRDQNVKELKEDKEEKAKFVDATPVVVLETKPSASFIMQPQANKQPSQEIITKVMSQADKMQSLATNIRPVIPSLANKTFETKMPADSSSFKPLKEQAHVAEKQKNIPGMFPNLLEVKPREKSIPNVVQHVGLFGDVNFSPRTDLPSRSLSLSPRPAKRIPVLCETPISKDPVSEEIPERRHTMKFVNETFAAKTITLDVGKADEQKIYSGKGVDQKVDAGKGDDQKVDAGKGDDQKVDARKRDGQKVDAGKEDGQKADAGKKDDQKADVWKRDTQEVDIGRRDTPKVDAWRRDTQKVDTGRRDTQKVDTGRKEVYAGKRDSQKADAGKMDNQKVDAAESDKNTNETKLNAPDKLQGKGETSAKPDNPNVTETVHTMEIKEKANEKSNEGKFVPFSEFTKADVETKAPGVAFPKTKLVKPPYTVPPLPKYFPDLGESSAPSSTHFFSSKPPKEGETFSTFIPTIIKERETVEKDEDTCVFEAKPGFEGKSLDIKDASLQTSVITFVSSSSSSSSSSLFSSLSSSSSSATDFSITDKKLVIKEEEKSTSLECSNENTDDYEVNQAIENSPSAQAKPSVVISPKREAVGVGSKVSEDEQTSTEESLDDDDKDCDLMTSSEAKTDFDENIQESLTELSLNDESKEHKDKQDRSFLGTSISNVFLNVSAEKTTTDVKELFVAKKTSPDASSFEVKKDESESSDQKPISLENKEEGNGEDICNVKEFEDHGSSCSLPTVKKEGKKKKSKIARQDKKASNFDFYKKEDMHGKEGKGKSRKRRAFDGDEMYRPRDGEQKTKSKKFKKSKNKKRFSKYEDLSPEMRDDNLEELSEKFKRKEKRRREEKKFSKFDLKSEGTSGERSKKEKKKGRKNKMGGDRKSEFGEKKMKEKRKLYGEDNVGDSDSDKDVPIRINEKKKKKDKRKLKPKEASSSDDTAEGKLLIDEAKLFSDLEEKNKDPDMSFLLCEEKVPASPVNALPEDTTASSSIDDSNNVSPSSDEEQMQARNSEVYAGSSTSGIPCSNPRNMDNCARFIHRNDNTPPTTPSSSESIPSSSPSHDQEPFVHYTESTQSGRESGDNESDGFPCNPSHVEVSESEEYSAASVLAFSVCKSIPEKNQECSRPLHKRQKSESEDYSPIKRRKKMKRSFGITDTPMRSGPARVRGLSHTSRRGESFDDFEDDHYPRDISSPPHLFSSFSHPSSQSTPIPHDSTSSGPNKSKHNLYMPLHEFKDPEKRISILQDKMSELRKLYASLKAEVASIDRRRKKARKKMREAAGSNLNTSLVMHLEEGQNCS